VIDELATIDDADDMWVVDAADGVGLAPKTLGGLFASMNIGAEELDSEGAPQANVLRFKNLTTAASSDLASHAVRARNHFPKMLLAIEL